MLFRLALVLSVAQFGTTYKHFQEQIPNGDSVPFPCKTGQTWQGVGHFLNEGTGPINPFGADFKKAGFLWTVELCEKDSDGDGVSNGVELGDANCTWKFNERSNITEAVSHPGICDPWDDAKCKNTIVTGGKYNTQEEWLTDACKSDGFICQNLTDPDVLNSTIQIPIGTHVPSKTTTYECQIFNIYELGVPRNGSFHMIAVTPIIDNKDILHHMVLSGCTDDTPTTAEPFNCGMTASSTCQQFLHVWTVGLDGECYHPQSGVRIGDLGYKVLAIQLHWNNPQQKTDFQDGSGLLFYYTPKLRPYDAGVLMIGSSQFVLPPRMNEVTVKGTCASGCTQRDMIGSVNITSVWNHMHYAGRKMSIEVKRDDKHVTYLTNDKTYSYDSPLVYPYNTPFVLSPGDELITNCGFSTTDRNKSTSFGEATLDEMCFGFITYYPLQNYTRPFCVDALDVSECNRASWGKCEKMLQFIGAIESTSLFKDVLLNCKSFNPCLPECVDTIVKYSKTEPCMTGNVWDYIQLILSFNKNFGADFLSRLASCKTEVFIALNPVEEKCALGDSVGRLHATAMSLVLTIMSMAVIKMM